MTKKHNGILGLLLNFFFSRRDQKHIIFCCCLLGLNIKHNAVPQTHKRTSLLSTVRQPHLQTSVPPTMKRPLNRPNPSELFSLGGNLPHLGCVQERLTFANVLLIERSPGPTCLGGSPKHDRPHCCVAF